MTPFCGLYERGDGVAEGLDAMLAASYAGRAGRPARWTNGPVGLGQRRAGEDGTARAVLPPGADGCVVVASGRLDDRDGLCDTLGIPRPQRAGLTDRELIARACMRWGRDAPSHLLGDYAFAVWNPAQRALVCARDHIGAQPFYYSLTPRRFAFASDVRGVLAAPGVPDGLDERAVATRLTYGARSLGTRTFFRAVRRLPPGHTLTVTAGTVRIERYWRPEDAPRAPPGSGDDYAEAFLELCSRAVADRLRGAGPVGVHLSGGLDSSSVAVLAARELRRRARPPPPAFCWLPPPGPGPRTGAEAAEYDLVETVAAREGLAPCWCAPSPGDVVAALRHAGSLGDTESTLVQEEAVQRRAAAQGVRVLLSGWGGDEGISFNGRGYHAGLLASGRVRRLLREAFEARRVRGANPLRLLLVSAVLPLLPWGSMIEGALLRRGRPFARKRTFLHPAFARRVKPLPDRPRRPVGVRRTQLQLLESGHLVRRIEAWAASGARHGVEYRYPLLDRRVLEFALGLPGEMYRRGGWSRWLMRHALRQVLPPAICWNASKADPVRYEAFVGAFAEALPVLRRALEARPLPPSRARYLDMPRLLASLDADRFRRNRTFGVYGNALQFLDF